MSSIQVIPSHAELMFSWVRSKIYQWDQDMYDGTIARFECINFIDGAFVLPLLPDGRILLTLQEQPWRKQFISLPGGSFDTPTEDPMWCAYRELREETWYSSSILDTWIVYHGTSNVHTNVYYYIARDCFEVWKIIPDGWEKIELFKVSFDEFIELSSDERFHHHWNLLPKLDEARHYPHKK